MKKLNPFGLLALLLICALSLGIGSCSSVSDDVLGTDQTTASDDDTSGQGDVSDDEGTDEGDEDA